MGASDVRMFVHGLKREMPIWTTYVRDMNVAEICPKNLATQALVVCNSSIRFGDPSYETDLRSILRVYERSFKEG